MTSNMKMKYEHEKKWNTMDLKSNDLLFSVIDKCYISLICFHINCGLFMYFIQAHSSLFLLSSSTPPPSVSHPVPEGHICMNRRKWHAYEITKPFTQYSHSSTCTNTKCVRACVCVSVCVCVCIACSLKVNGWSHSLFVFSLSVSLALFLFLSFFSHTCGLCVILLIPVSRSALCSSELIPLALWVHTVTPPHIHKFIKTAQPSVLFPLTCKPTTLFSSSIITKSDMIPNNTSILYYVSLISTRIILLYRIIAFHLFLLYACFLYMFVHPFPRCIHLECHILREMSHLSCLLFNKPY